MELPLTGTPILWKCVKVITITSARGGVYTYDKMKCLDYQYYVKSLDDCFSCPDLCNNRESRGNSLTACLQECPEYYQTYMMELASTAGTSLTEQTRDNDENNDNFLHIGLPCIIAVILLIITIIGVITCLKNRRRRKMPTQETGTDEQMVYQMMQNPLI